MGVGNSVSHGRVLVAVDAPNGFTYIGKRHSSGDTDTNRLALTDYMVVETSSLVTRDTPYDCEAVERYERLERNKRGISKSTVTFSLDHVAVNQLI